MSKRKGQIDDEEWRDIQDRASKAYPHRTGSPEDVRRTIQGRDSLNAARRGEN